MTYNIISAYLLISVIMIFPFKIYSNKCIKQLKKDKNPDYIDAVSFVGEKNTFLFFWLLFCLFWPMTLFDITLNIIKIKGH